MSDSQCGEHSAVPCGLSPTSQPASARSAHSADVFLQDVIRGLGANPKKLNPKYFYDEAGSRLFAEITRTPEYYITRVETALMNDIAPALTRALADRKSVVEFGSGSGRRTDILLESLEGLLCYAPLDVSPELLRSTSRRAREGQPDIEIIPFAADFSQPLQLPERIPHPRLGYFPGSTIGNFDHEAAASFLARAKRALGEGAAMLLGADLVKQTEILERAYNDAQGITARFNKNILHRINRELGADFDPDQFEHRAHFDAERSRVEMHLVSRCDQHVRLGPRHFEFRRGETIHTENSHKFTIEGIRELASQAGWETLRSWTDPERLFSVHLLGARP